MKYGDAFCRECGEKNEQMTDKGNENETEISNNIKASAVTTEEAAKKAKEDKQNAIIGLVLIGIIIAAILFVFSLFFGGGIEVDYGEFGDTDEVSLSGFEVDYNEDIGYITIEGTIKSKVDCYECISVYVEVYNEYDRKVGTCRIDTDALSKGEKYSFDDMYNIESGSDITKIKVSDVLVF